MVQPDSAPDLTGEADRRGLAALTRRFEAPGARPAPRRADRRGLLAAGLDAYAGAVS